MNKIEEMTERDLVRYINQLQRAKEGYDRESFDETENAEHVMPDVGMVQPPVDILRELTNAKEALRRFRRKSVSDEEKRAIIKRTMGFECAKCHNMFARTGKIPVDGKDYCRDCAKEIL